MQKVTTAIPHNIIMENRKSLRISGVKDIDSFSENRIVLSTVMGELVIRGDDLHVNSLDSESGDFSMTGCVNSISYNRHSVLDGPVKKLFR
ncbi:MAG: sporulation protein YabP [Oscillospiraceae bacterium]|nr:sporulation protein YabP [Oscillospiraceae bacterium]